MRELAIESCSSAALLTLVLAAHCSAPRYRFDDGASNDASTTERDSAGGDSSVSAPSSAAAGTPNDADSGSYGGESGGSAGHASSLGGAGGGAGRGNVGGLGGASGNGGAGGSSHVDGCDRANWTATASSSSLVTNPPQLYNPPIQAIDGDAATRWSSGGVQSPGQWFGVDLGALASLTEVRLDTLQSPTDAPVGYSLEVSTNGVDYRSVATGAGTPNTIILLTATVARSVRVVQTGSSATAWWSIHEFSLGCTPL
jgi:hypothetical protein